MNSIQLKMPLKYVDMSQADAESEYGGGWKNVLAGAAVFAGVLAFTALCGFGTSIWGYLIRNESSVPFKTILKDTMKSFLIGGAIVGAVAAIPAAIFAEELCDCANELF